MFSLSASRTRTGGIQIQLYSALDRVEWSTSRPDRFNPGNYRIGGWIGSRVNLDILIRGKNNLSGQQSYLYSSSRSFFSIQTEKKIIICGFFISHCSCIVFNIY